MTAARLLAIDPGVSACGCAWFADGRLEGVRMTPAPEGYVGGIVLVERPEYQGERSQTARIQDLISLAWAGARAAAFAAGASGGRVVELTPSQWKGTTPKPVHHARLWERLTFDERVLLGGNATLAAISDAAEKGALRRWPAGFSAYPRSFTMHNMLDAVGLGMYYLGRMAKQ